MIEAIHDLPVDLLYSGKVRDTYELSGGRLLMVASDRISAFDVILPSLIPGKGIVLTQLSKFWFEALNDIVPNHLTGEEMGSLGWPDEIVAPLEARAMIVRRAERIPIECVVRGYLAGSGWLEYQAVGSIGGHAVPGGLPKSAQLPEPIFTPANKNDVGHDENISVQQAREIVGADLTDRLEAISLHLYDQASKHARDCGIIIADTKFEFGLIGGVLTLIDEVLTPDSSRFWDVELWRPGQESESFDKQYVRNWLLSTDWNRESPGPGLPPDVIAGTIQRYELAFERLTGSRLHDWLRSRRKGADV
jgi:phosphoribosylaminoimidazole-succinocarboxamide synthase